MKKSIVINVDGEDLFSEVYDSVREFIQEMFDNEGDKIKVIIVEDHTPSLS